MTLPRGLCITLIQFLDRVCDGRPNQYIDAYHFTMRWLQDNLSASVDPWDDREAYRLVQKAWSAFVASGKRPA